MPLDLRKLSERVSENQSPLRQAPRSSGPGKIGGTGATGTWPATQGGTPVWGWMGPQRLQTGPLEILNSKLSFRPA